MVDFGDFVLDEAVGFFPLGQFPVPGVVNAVTLCPVFHRIHVDIDHRSHVFAIDADGYRLLDIRREFELVFQELGGEQGAVPEAVHVFGPVDDLQVARLVDESGIPGLHPAVFDERLPGRLLILEVPLEVHVALQEDLSVVVDLYFNAGQGPAHRIGASLAVGLEAARRRAFRQSIELFQIDSQGTQVIEYIRPQGRAARVAQPYAAQSQQIA